MQLLEKIQGILKREKMEIYVAKVIIRISLLILCVTTYFFVGVRGAPIAKADEFQWQYDLTKLMENDDDYYNEEYYRSEV